MIIVRRYVGFVTRSPVSIDLSFKSTSDFLRTLALPLIFLCVIFYVSRAAAREGTRGESGLYGDFWNLIKALPDTSELSNKSQSRAPAAWLEIFEKEVEGSEA